MKLRSRFAPAATLPAAFLSFGLLPSTFAQVSPSHVAPAIERLGKNLGQESPSTQLSLSVWLNLHNQADLDSKVAALYAKGSPTFHQWLSPSDLKTYMPTAAELSAVKKELAAHNLTITSVDPSNYVVHFTGKASDVESAFHTTISRYTVTRSAGRGSVAADELVRTTSTVPALSGAATGLVSHVGGLNSLTMEPYFKLPVNPTTKKPYAGVPVSPKPAGAIFASQCFYAPASVTITGPSTADGVTPETLKVTGLTYGAPLTNTANGTQAPCGYSASQVQSIYGLSKAYAQGVTGKGQTIVVLDPYLEPTIQADMDAFSAQEGIADTTINILNPLGAVLNGGQQGWNVEADLDVELSHAAAPGAQITLLEAATSDNEDLQAAVLYAVENKLGNIISNSYGSPESFSSPLDNALWNNILELAASEGISVHFATGDQGDFSADFANGTTTDVSSPADSPYATAVGGTSVDLDPSGSMFTTGWGTNLAILDYIAYVSPTNQTLEVAGDSIEYFYSGSGGGTSAVFAKPSYQASLPGNGRHLPDVSALADPYTGAEVVYTEYQGPQVTNVIGGTSLATPVFSGIWALVNQAASGSGSLGQAAPIVAATANTPFIDDVMPVQGPANITGTLTTPTGTTNYSAVDLAGPLGTTTTFTSAIQDAGSGTYNVVTFGTDSSLTITQGWDNVTGYGTPNIGAIADLIAQYK